MSPPPFLIAAFALIAFDAFAADGVWNNTKTSGNWNASANWIGGQIADGPGATATFNAGSSTTTVSLTDSRTVGAIVVNGVTATTNAISFASTNVLTLQGSGPAAIPLFNIAGSSDFGLTLGSGVQLAGSSGFEKKGSGALSISSANSTFTGDVLLTEGVIRSIGQNALNGQTLIVNGANTEWRVDAGTHTSNVVLRHNGTISGVGGSGSVTADATVAGIISQTGATPLDMTYFNSVGGADRRKRFIVTGDNSYTGNTTIGRSSPSITILQVAHNNALGKGNATVTIASSANHDQNTLEITAGTGTGITISNKTLVLNGRGNNAEGSLANRTGENTWAGDIELGVSDNPTIAVANATKLTVTGEIRGDAPGGLFKRGGGTLVFEGENSYTTGTTIIAGVLSVGHNKAIGYDSLIAGSGNLSLVNNSRLEIQTGVSLQVGNFDLDSANQFYFNLAAGSLTQVVVHGSLAGDANYLVNLNISGALAPGEVVLLSAEEYSGFTGSFAIGAALPPELTGSTLSWEDGVLTLHVIPEPRIYALLLPAMVGLLWNRRGKQGKSLILK